MATFQNRNGRWRAIVRKKGHPAQSATFRTKGQAQRWAKEVEDMMSSGALARQNTLEGVTVARALDAHLAHLDTVSSRGRKNAGEAALLKAHFGDLPLAQLDYAALVQFCRTRMRVDGVGPSTLHHNIMFLAGAVSTAVLDLGVPKAYADELAVWRKGLTRAGLIGLSQRRDRRPTNAELTALRTYFTERYADFKLPYLDLMDFAVASAMRLGEIVSLRWQDLDVDNGVVLVRQRKHPTEKRYNDQRVPLLGDALEVLQRRAPVGERIYPYVAESVGNGFRRACQELGIDDLTFHDLRHEGISRLFERGYGIEEVALVSGHRDWGSLKRYANLRPTDLVAKDRSLHGGGRRPS